MAAVVRLEDEAYGAAIQRDIQDSVGRPVNIGTVYVTLARLESQGLLEMTTALPSERAPGARSRRYCRATQEGLLALRDTSEAFERMLAGINLPDATPERR